MEIVACESLKKKCSADVNPCEPWLSMRMNSRNRNFTTEAMMTGLARQNSAAVSVAGLPAARLPRLIRRL